MDILNDNVLFLEQRTKINNNFTECDSRLSALEQQIGVYAKLDAEEDTIMTDADSYYRLEGVFSNPIAYGFTAGPDGITYSGSDMVFKTDFNLSGKSDKTAEICIALVLDATFDANGKMTAGTVLSGSEGCDQADVVGSSDGAIQLVSFWSGEVATGDRISLVVKSDVAATTFTSSHSAARLTRFF